MGNCSQSKHCVEICLCQIPISSLISWIFPKKLPKVRNPKSKVWSDQIDQIKPPHSCKTYLKESLPVDDAGERTGPNYDVLPGQKNLKTKKIWWWRYRPQRRCTPRKMRWRSCLLACTSSWQGVHRKETKLPWQKKRQNHADRKRDKIMPTRRRQNFIIV